MDKLFDLLSHFDILLFLSAIALFVVATIGKIAIPKTLPPTSLSLWQRMLFGVISFILLALALLPLLPTKIIFTGKLLAAYEGEVVAPPARDMSPEVYKLPEIPTRKQGLLLVTARGFSERHQEHGKPWITPTFQIVLKLDGEDIGSARSSWYFVSGTVNLNPTISTSFVLPAGQHTLQIAIEQQYAVRVRGTQLRYQLLELD